MCTVNKHQVQGFLQDVSEVSLVLEAPGDLGREEDNLGSNINRPGQARPGRILLPLICL